MLSALSRVASDWKRVITTRWQPLSLCLHGRWLFWVSSIRLRGRARGHSLGHHVYHGLAHWWLHHYTLATSISSAAIHKLGTITVQWHLASRPSISFANVNRKLL